MLQWTDRHRPIYHQAAVPQHFLSAQACILFIEQATFVFQVSLPYGRIIAVIGWHGVVTHQR